MSRHAGADPDGASDGPGASGKLAVPAWTETLARVLDDAVRVPGTNLRFGADAIVGLLVPTAGDALTGIAQVAILVAAWRARVPTVVLARMVMNIGVDALVGSVPVLGDAFDVVWKASRANVGLLRRHVDGADGAALARRPRAADYLVVGLGVTFAVAIVLLPLAVLAALVAYAARR